MNLLSHTFERLAATASVAVAQSLLWGGVSISQRVTLEDGQE